MTDTHYLRVALRLARRGYGRTSPNPMVGAVLVKDGNIIGRGWHRQAGGPHAEIEALRDAQKRGLSPRGAALYVTLEPCCTYGRTPPCTNAIRAAGIKRVVAGATDPNPKHAGNGFRILRDAGVEVAVLGESNAPELPVGDSAKISSGNMARGFRPLARRERSRRVGTPGSVGRAQPSRRAKDHAKSTEVIFTPSLSGDLRSRGAQRLRVECVGLNEAFNHWIVSRTPFVTVKAAMTLDGKIATARGESKWITGEKARALGMKLRQGSDAILVGINTILADDPSLTVRPGSVQAGGRPARPIRRIVLDSLARTPLSARVVSDEFAALTTIVVSKQAPGNRVAALAKRVPVVVAPTTRPSSLAASPRRTSRRSRDRSPALDLRWLLKRLGGENVTSLLVEGGGEVNASFLLARLAQRVAFFYAPKVLGGRDARKGVAGDGATSLSEVVRLEAVHWRKLGEDLLLTARVVP